MTPPTRLKVATALRSTSEPAPKTGSTSRRRSDPPLVILRKRIETILFFAFSVAPLESLLQRSLAALKANADWIEMESNELVDAWEAEVHHLRANFVLDPASWQDADCAAFQSGVSEAFGVRGKNINRLLLEFYRMPEPRRLAILVLIERTPYFNYIIDQVDSAPPMPVENARESMEMLMQRVWGSR